jgi:hypothetical protein
MDPMPVDGVNGRREIIAMRGNAGQRGPQMIARGIAISLISPIVVPML